MSSAYRYISIEAPTIGATIDFLGDGTSVKVYMDRTSEPPTLRIEVTAAPSATNYASKFESFEFELPVAEPSYEDEEADDEIESLNNLLTELSEEAS